MDTSQQNILLELEHVKKALRMQRFAWGLAGLFGAPLLLGLGFQEPGPVKATRFEVVDSAGKVRARIEPGRIALYNSVGLEKARLTTDETNGNLVLSGGKQERLEVFMDPSTPRIVFYGPDGGPTMVIPPAESRPN